MSTAPQNTDAPPGPQPGAADKRRKRLNAYTVRNMVLSVLPVLALVMIWWAFFDNSSSPQTPRAVEVGGTASHAVDQSDFPVWVPDPGEEWAATVAWYDDRVEGVPTWHVSYVSPAGEYVALSQAGDVNQEWLADRLSGGEQVGQARLPSPIGDQPFEEYAGPVPSNAEAAYLLGPDVTGGSTVVVHGTAERAEFEELLRAVETRD